MRIHPNGLWNVNGGLIVRADSLFARFVCHVPMWIPLGLAVEAARVEQDYTTYVRIFVCHRHHWR